MGRDPCPTATPGSHPAELPRPQLLPMGTHIPFGGVLWAGISGQHACLMKGVPAPVNQQAWAHPWPRRIPPLDPGFYLPTQGITPGHSLLSQQLPHMAAPPRGSSLPTSH